MPLRGFLGVSRERLRALDGDKLESLAKTDELELVYLHLASMRNFNDDELADFIELTKEKSLDVRFIEFMPFDSNDWKSKKFISMAEMHEKVSTAYGERIVKICNEEASSTSKGF